MPLKALIMEDVVLAALQLYDLVVRVESAQTNDAFGCFSEYDIAEGKLFHGANESRVTLRDLLGLELAATHFSVQHVADEES